MQFPGHVTPTGKSLDVKSLIVDAGSKLQLSKWSSVLCKAAKNRISPGSKVVDLGAGPEAIVSRYMIESGVPANWLAIEPYYSVNAPSEVTVIRGDLRALAANSVDMILFNPPVVPLEYLNPSSRDCHIFMGGADGTETIDEVVVESQRCLHRNGHLIILCPSFIQPPLLLEKNPCVLAYDYESFISFSSRAPLHHSKTAAELMFDIQRRSDAAVTAWERRGIPHQPNSFAVIALEVCYS